MGAGKPSKLTDAPLLAGITSGSTSGPMPVVAETVPEIPVAMPVPVMSAIPPAEIPGWKLAPFRNARLLGPASRDVSVNDTLNPAAVAVTVIEPAAPAVTVVEACPLLSVVVEGEPTEADPDDTANVTGTPPTA